jgi:hypothetical protein
MHDAHAVLWCADPAMLPWLITFGWSVGQARNLVASGIGHRAKRLRGSDAPTGNVRLDQRRPGWAATDFRVGSAGWALAHIDALIDKVTDPSLRQTLREQIDILLGEQSFAWCTSSTSPRPSSYVHTATTYLSTLRTHGGADTHRAVDQRSVELLVSR